MHFRHLSRAFAPFIFLVLWSCSSAPEHGFKQGRGRAAVWVTSADGRLHLERGQDVELSVTTEAAPTIDIDPSQRFQTMVGFGAAITDASAWLIEKKLSATQRETLLRELFGPPPGLAISFARLTIGASDFSLSHYSLDDVPAGATDPKLQAFTLAPIKDTVLPVVRAALSENAALKIMASPWSAPAWMKTNGSLIKGSLAPEFYGAFADYLVKYLDAMQAQGIPIYALTVQNEPHFEPKNYPGMRLTAAQRATLLGHYLGPALSKKTRDTKILEWDHNWDRPQEPLAVLADPDAAQYVSGVAWHCYAGHVPAQKEVHAAHPDKDAYLTECSGGGWGSDSPLLRMTRQLIVGSTRAWARGVLLWNLALDESAGPHTGGCNNCRGLVTIDSKSGAISRNDDYYVIAHASRFVQPGAERVASTETGDGLANVAFRNPGGSIVLILVNSLETRKEISVRCRDSEFSYRLAARSVATLTFQYN
jgi:glucosylceramidase